MFIIVAIIFSLSIVLFPFIIITCHIYSLRVEQSTEQDSPNPVLARTKIT